VATSAAPNGKITPSLDALARIAQALNTSLDHLVFDDIPHRKLNQSEAKHQYRKPSDIQPGRQRALWECSRESIKRSDEFRCAAPYPHSGPQATSLACPLLSILLGIVGPHPNDRRTLPKVWDFGKVAS